MSRHAAPRRWPRTPRTDDRSTGRQTAVVAAVVAVVGALTGVAWLLPVTHVRPHQSTRAQTVALSYRASVAGSPAYDGTTVTSPQPVFRAVTDAIAVEATYRGAPGRMRVDARLSTPGGWTSTVPLAGTRSVDGGGDRILVPVRLSTLDRRAQAAGRVTGLPATPVTVTIVPIVSDGKGHVFAPEFPLTLTALALTPVDAGRLTATKAEPVTEMAPTAATVRVLGHTVSISSARRVTTAALALALLAAAALLGARAVHRSRGEAERIQRRWRELLLDVHPMPAPPGRPVIDVPTFSTLVRLAQRYELLILHWARSGVHTYVVQDDASVFRYRTGDTAAATGVPAAEMLDEAKASAAAPA